MTNVRASLRWRLSTYAMLVGIGVRELLAYRAGYLLRILNLLMQIFLLSTVWTAVYRGRGSVDGVDLSTMVAYVTLISVQAWWFGTATYSALPARVRSGHVAFDLTRPLGLVGQIFPKQVGAALGMLPFVLVALPVAAVIGELRAPPNITAAAVYAVSLLLAFTVATLAGTLVGLSAFWTLETRALQFIYSTIAGFFTGALVPLWFMPDWLRLVAQVLPFQTIGYTPVSVYLGRFKGAQLWGALAVQGLWVVALAGLCALVWRRAVHKVVIQGG